MVDNKFTKFPLPSCQQKDFCKTYILPFPAWNFQWPTGPFMTGLCLPLHPRIHHHAPATHRYLHLPQFAGTTQETLNLGVSSLFLLPDWFHLSFKGSACVSSVCKASLIPISAWAMLCILPRIHAVYRRLFTRLTSPLSSRVETITFWRMEDSA